jgi:5-methylcytosine-specific restriction endonuclease McrA
MIEFRRLKIFWNDVDDLDFLDRTISELQQREEDVKTYRYRRIKGFTAKLRSACLERDERKCVKCKSEEQLEVDHIIELIDGGGNESTNTM